MKLNKMRHSIKILGKKEVENIFGEIAYEWVPKMYLKARKQRLSNVTSVAAGKDKFTETYKFIVRYNPLISVNDRVCYAGEMYNITHVNNILELAQHETQIECVKHDEDVRN